MEEKYSDDVQKLLDMGMGKEKAFLTYDEINQELPEGLVSPDEIEDIFAALGGEGITIADSEEKFLETAVAAANADKKDDDQGEEVELDLSPGNLEKTNDPVRLYLREMGVVPLLTREGEVAIAKRIERGKIRAQKAISRSPISVAELIQIGKELNEEYLTVREIVTFTEQEGITEEKILEYHNYTLETIAEINKVFKKTSQMYEKVLAEPKRSPKLAKMKRKLSRQRIELSHLFRLLEFTPKVQERLVGAMRRSSMEVKETEREIDKLQRSYERKRNEDEKKEVEKKLRATKRHLTQLEEQHRLPALDIKRSLQTVIAGEAEARVQIIERNGVLEGRITTLFARPDVSPDARCDRCTGSRKGEPVQGMTILTGPVEVIVALCKAALFGLAASLIACYKGISVGGGPAGVGNAVNETVVLSFMALFFINVIATAIGVQAAQ